ncbi:Hypothetical protein R9X50_00107600 [Acrodontium crateriforme]|uniref:Uncharacterized protein n=1 Tax=Acrodontium crateriforme TaxID=150365 RepID=A0AAQ3R5H5_9PEZI|nr:Hypothetical protein R9X50_00107600 [Acrodontium crateriforme]
MANSYTAMADIVGIFHIKRPSLDDTPKALKRSSRTMEDFKLGEQPTPLSTYESGEEAMSPVDSDDAEFYSMSDSVSIASSLDDSDWKCDQAEAIRVVPAGTVKLVSINVVNRKRRADSSLSQEAPASERGEKFPDGSSNASHSRSSSSSTVKSSASTPPSSVPSSPASSSTPRFKKYQPSVPLIQAANLSKTHIISQVRTSKEIQRSQTLPSQNPAQRLRKKHKFSSTFNRLSRSSFESDDDNDKIDILDALVDSEIRTQLIQPPKRSKPKMIARGANERAPPPKLPPCPDNYRTDDAVISCQRAKDLTAWHQKERSTTLL